MSLANTSALLSSIFGVKAGYDLFFIGIDLLESSKEEKNIEQKIGLILAGASALSGIPIFLASTIKTVSEQDIKYLKWYLLPLAGYYLPILYELAKSKIYQQGIYSGPINQ